MSKSFWVGKSNRCPKYHGLWRKGRSGEVLWLFTFYTVQRPYLHKNQIASLTCKYTAWISRNTTIVTWIDAGFTRQIYKLSYFNGLLCSRPFWQFSPDCTGQALSKMGLRSLRPGKLCDSYYEFECLTRFFWAGFFSKWPGNTEHDRQSMRLLSGTSRSGSKNCLEKGMLM